MVLKLVIHYFELLLSFVLDLTYRSQKIVEYYWTHKHEIERICESNYDIYEKSMLFDKWLMKTRTVAIRSFIEKQFDNTINNDSNNNINDNNSIVSRSLAKLLDQYKNSQNTSKLYSSESQKNKSSRQNYDKAGDQLGKCDNIYEDLVLSSLIKELTEKFLKLIIKTKHLHKLPAKQKECLRDIIYRVISYKLTLLWAEKLASIKYDSNLDTHTSRLICMWNNLIRDDDKPPYRGSQNDTKVFPKELSFEITRKSDIVSSRWSHIGFQGEDPGTDFRGMGMLGLYQLLYLTEKPNKLAGDLLRRSLNEKYGYPFAIVGINITYNLLQLFKDGSMKHLYYDTGDILFRESKYRSLNLLKAFNDLYVELFLRFDCFWIESKPETIFQFKELMEKFVDIVKMDLCNRNFSLKFIY